MRICEIFYSLQGEGMLMGIPTVFVRTVGCNLDCEWCDTPYAREGGVEMEVQEVTEKVLSHGIRTVCITGGELLLQEDICDLIDSFAHEGCNIQLETNGSLPIDRLPTEYVMISMDVKTPSSGMSGRMMMDNIGELGICDQLKFVVSDRDDMDFVERTLDEHRVSCPVILTAVGGTDLRNVAEWVLERKMEVRVLPQLHKLIWGKERGR
jgi:7-carboxy-7-deazaguanine synthase